MSDDCQDYCEDYDEDYDEDYKENYDEDYDEDYDECGLLPKHLGGGCTMAGTEYCDFDCSVRRFIEEHKEEEDDNVET